MRSVMRSVALGTMGMLLAIDPALEGAGPAPATAVPTTRPVGPNSLDKGRLIFEAATGDIDVGSFSHDYLSYARGQN